MRWLAVLFAGAVLGCAGDGTSRHISSPNFSLSGATSVTTELQRIAYFTSNGVADTVLNGDTTTTVPFDGDYAIPMGNDGSGHMVAVLNHTEFDTPLQGGGYWAAVDSNGTYHAIRLESGSEGSWARIVTYSGETMFTAESTAVFEAQFNDVTGGWLLESSTFTLTLDDGGHFAIDAALGTTTYAEGLDQPGILDAALASFTILNPRKLSASEWLSATVSGDCDEELMAAATAVGVAVGTAIIARAWPTPFNVNRAIAAGAVAILAGANAVRCLWDEAQSLDPG